MDGFWNSKGSRGRIAFIIPVMPFISKVISLAFFFLLSHCFPTTAATFCFAMSCGGAGPRVTAFGDVWVWQGVLKRGGGHIQSPPSLGGPQARGMARLLPAGCRRH